MKNPNGQIPNLDAALDAYVAGTESLRRLRPTSTAKTVACSAAATAALALAPSADASIQYGVTNYFAVLAEGTSPPSITPEFDLDGDGLPDFGFQLSCASNRSNEFVLRGSARYNAVEFVLPSPNDPTLSRLSLGNAIGDPPLTNFFNNGIIRFWNIDTENNPAIGWPGDSMNEANAGFLGIRFNHSNNIHYGWIRIGISNQISGGGPVAFTVYDWAWETTPETAITITAIPEPGPGAGLALLAAGAAGVSAWRRRKQTPAQSAQSA